VADLVLLLSLIEDPSATVEQLKGGERSWLRKCEAQLAWTIPANHPAVVSDARSRAGVVI
jgi:hypothetical protein